MGQERRYVSTDPNFGAEQTEKKYVSTDPDFGEPLRVATRGENAPAVAAPAPTWSDRLGLNRPTDSMITGFHRGMGGAAVDLVQGAVSQVGSLMRDKLAADQPNVTPPEVLDVETPQTGAGEMGAFLPDVAAMAVPVGGAVKGAGAAVNAIPRVARAGEKFQEVMGAAKNIPIDVKDVGDAALRIQQLADRGGSMPLAVRKLLNRLTDPNKAAMTYEESRDFASNISRLSVNEFGRLTPAVAREVANLRVVLNQANARAAELAGKGAEYKSAMREYARAMKLREAVDSAMKGAKKGLPVATAAGLGYWLTRQVRSALGAPE